MNDLATADLPPNVFHLQRVQHNTLVPVEPEAVSVPTFGFTLQTFASKCDVKLLPTCSDPTFGFRLATDTTTNRAYISKIQPDPVLKTSAAPHKPLVKNLLAISLLLLLMHPCSLLPKPHVLFTNLPQLHRFLFHYPLTLAPKPLPTAHNHNSALCELNIFSAIDSSNNSADLLLNLDSLRAIYRLHTADPINCDDITNDEIDLIIHALQSESITAAKCALGSFTRRQLKTLVLYPPSTQDT
jgi:hypothetical protein